MEPTVKACKVFGIEINLAYSWFLIFVFATIVMAMQFDANFPDWTPTHQFFWGLATSVLFFGSILGHEVAHGLVARYHNIRVHSITLHVFGGWARLNRPARSPFEEFTIAIAGPLSSLLFAFAFALIWMVSAEAWPALAILSGRLAWINLILAIFNTLPTFPLDGGLVLRAILWRLTKEYITATRLASYIGQTMAAGFMILGLALFLWLGMIGIWLLFIGYNFLVSSRAHLKEANLKDSFRAFKVGDLALQQLPQVSAQLTVNEFLEAYPYNQQQQDYYLVVDAENIAGLLVSTQINSVSAEASYLTPIAQVMTPLNRLEMINPETNIVSALELMDCIETTQLPVVQDQQLRGFICRDSLVNFICNRFDYGTPKAN